MLNKWHLNKNKEKKEKKLMQGPIKLYGWVEFIKIKCFRLSLAYIVSITH